MAIIDEAANFEPRWLREKMLREVQQREIEQYKRYYLPEPPKQPESVRCLIHYIGGPRNCQQEYHTIEMYPGRPWNVVVQEPFDLESGAIRSLVFTYTLTAIPRDQTPFCEEQIVVAVYKEN